jgi:N-acyl-D-aspartate/D-glutamate deacylase
VAARRGAGYSTHVRDEARGVFDSVREAVAVAEHTGVRTRIVHIKLSGIENWGGAPRLLEELSAAPERGVPVDCDQYPYMTATVAVRNLLPVWIQEGGAARMLQRLSDPKARDDIRADVAVRGLNAFGRIPSWEAVRVTMSLAGPGEVGHTIAHIAVRRGCDPVDAICDILLADRGATRGLIDAMHEEDVRAFVACPWVFVGSDGRAFGPAGPLAGELPHPRFYGTFPRILGHYTRDLGMLTLPQAIHKMTGGPAAALGLTDRGVLRPGAAADLTVFDPASITDRATFDDPRRYPAGIAHVIVNGVPVINNGAHTGALPGRVLRRTAVGVA